MSDFFNENAEYLLNRKIRSFEKQTALKTVCGKAVLVTGGGGSIGSELCLYAAELGARKVVIVDINENNIHKALKKSASIRENTEIKAVVASIRDRERMFEIFREAKPDVIFHAAAHKHVSFMENDPREAVKNNIFGTLNVADAAEDCGASQFVLISTDKAVTPTSVMGATKRFCEYIAASRSHSKTVFSTVRFGNVLGSDGSVMPDFADMIRRGETLKITAPEVKRYFMTVREAAELVFAAASLGNPGIFVLDMGKPVVIADMAKRLGDLLSREVKIEYTALGCGEKLSESLSYGLPDTTVFDFVGKESPPDIDKAEIDRRVALLRESLYSDSTVVDALSKTVEEYKK